MPITVAISGNSREFETLPEGVYPAVLADIVDLGPRENKFKPGTMTNALQFVWLTSEVDSTGRTFRAMQFVNQPKYLHEKAGLTKIVKSILGKLPTGDGDFVVDDLIGSQAQLVIQHSEPNKDGNVYANVTSIMKPKAGTKVNIPVDFERKTVVPAAK